jgi:hypothetical protein
MVALSDPLLLAMRPTMAYATAVATAKKRMVANGSAEGIAGTGAAAQRWTAGRKGEL